MYLTLRPFRSSLSALAMIFALALLCASQATAQNEHSNIRIKNFGQMDEQFYRGAQPKEADYQALAALGVKTVIDLQEETKSYERPAVEALGMHYVNIPMSDKDYPKMEQISRFLQLMNDPSTGKVYVHCAGGRHRTGVMGAVYRFNKYHWNYDQVYSEMKQYDFYTRWGHGDMKKFVEDYWQQIQANGFPGATAGLPAQSVSVK
jgi:protein tyrosine/serine phosphatase